MDSLGNVMNNMTPPEKTSRTTSNAENAHLSEVCPICDGMGLVKKRVPVGHPDFGKAFPCVCQRDKLIQRQHDQLHLMSNLKAYEHLTFDFFFTHLEWLTPEQNDDLRMAFEVAQNFAKNPFNSWLLIRGGYGSGKTHLAAAIGNYRLQNQQSVIFMTVPDVLDHLRRTYAPGSEVGYDALFEQIKNAPMLILDDLGSESPTPWANEKLFQLLNHRYVSQLPTVITTNEDFEKLDARLRSRLVDMHLTRTLDLAIPDYRRGGEVQSQSELSYLRLYSHMNFETFFLQRSGITPEQRKNIERAYGIAEEFARKPRGWLMFLGEHGSGKTHLAASIANYRQVILGAPNPVVLVTTADLLDYLRAAFNPSARDSLDTRFNEIRTAPLLILDHFQLQTATPWAKEKLFQILDYRYLAALPTVITKAGNDIQDLDPSFRSRLLDARICRIFLITAPDYRGGRMAQPRE